MNTSKLLSVTLALLLVTAGVSVTGAATSTDDTTEDGALALAASYDNGTVTVTVTENESLVEGANVSVDGSLEGATDENGTLAFEWDGTDGDELTVAAATENGSAEQTYRLEDGALVAVESEDASLENATVAADYDNGTVTLSVTANDTAVRDVEVTADGEDVGSTDENGTVNFEWNATEELQERTQAASDGDDNETEDDAATAELAVTLEKDGVTRNVTFTFEDGELTEETDDDGQGPPTSMPEQVPDHVEEIHELINRFLDGDLDASLGSAVSAVAGTDEKQSGQPDDVGRNGEEAGGENQGKPDHAGKDNGKDNDNKPDHAGKKSGDDSDDEDGS